MARGRSWKCAAVLALLVLAGLPAAAEEISVTVDLEESDGGGIKIEVSGDWLAETILEAVTKSFDCEAESDPDVRRMLLHLRKRGDGASYTLRETDKVTKAFRRDGRLELHRHEPDEKPTRIVLPWAIGECMLGNERPLRELGDDFEWKIEKDGSINLEFD